MAGPQQRGLLEGPMKKHGFGAAVVAALLALVLVPGTASAADPTVPGLQDQVVAAGAETTTIDSIITLTQTFRPEFVGRVTLVQLDCSGEASVTVAIGASSATNTCGSTPAWVFFVFADPPAVSYPAQYTMTITTNGTVDIAVAASDYAGGAAADNGSPITGVSDIAFQDYVQVAPQSSILWEPTGVQAGTTSTVKLSLFVRLPPVWIWNTGPVANVVATITLDSYPSGFHATSVSCTDPGFIADCSLAGPWAIHMDYGLSGTDYLITITGTYTAPATPGSVTAKGTSCIAYAYLGGTLTDCASGEENLVIGPGLPSSAPTPPASSTSSARDSSPVVPMPLGIAAGLCLGCSGLLLFLDRPRRRARRSRG